MINAAKRPVLYLGGGAINARMKSASLRKKPTCRPP
jgi:thiamine pyrophosphate-dependent acetolactate synthase large subunit-like protein